MSNTLETVDNCLKKKKRPTTWEPIPLHGANTRDNCWASEAGKLVNLIQFYQATVRLHEWISTWALLVNCACYLWMKNSNEIHTIKSGTKCSVTISFHAFKCSPLEVIRSKKFGVGKKIELVQKKVIKIKNLDLIEKILSSNGFN